MRRWRSQGRAVKGGRGGLGIALCGLLVSLWQSALAAPASLQSVLPRECHDIDSAHPARLELVAPADGLLRVTVEERGISTVSFLHDAKASFVGPTATEPVRGSASPVERFGTVVLTRDIHRSEQSEVEVHVEDSHDISGRVCVSADLIAPSDSERMNAERDLDAAGRAIQITDWATAFSRYLSAARHFDALGLPHSAAMARHAMGELAYLWLDRKRDAYALAGEAFSDYGKSGAPVVRGALAELEAKTLFDMPGNDPAVIAPAVRQWLALARQYESSDPHGARELPRLDILTGFLEYLLGAHDLSHTLFSSAAAQCRELHDWDCYALASQDLAQLAEQDRDYSLAMANYADALRALPPKLDPILTATIWSSLGRLQGNVGLFSASERSYSVAMQGFARLGDCQGVRRSLSRAGALLVHVGNLADAESDLTRATSLDCASLLASATAPEGPSPGYLVLDSANPRRNSREPADTAANQACAHPLEPGPLTRETRVIVFVSMLSLGNAAMLAGDSAQVWRCLDAAGLYSPDIRNQIRLANARGAAYLDKNDPKDARTAFTSALRIADKAGLPPTYDFRRSAQLGLVKSGLLAGDAATSLEGAYQALDASAARGDVESTITSLRLIAAARRGMGQTERAIHVLRVAADLIEAVPIDELNGEQRATFLASQHTVFAELANILAAGKEADDATAWHAFEASERGRARSLRYALKQQTRDASSPLDAPPTTKYQHLLSDVVKATEHTVTGSSHDGLIDEIDKLALREEGSTEILERAQLAHTLKQLNATLIEYASGAEETLAFVITADTARVIHLGDTREIGRITGDLRERLRDTDTPASEVRATAQELARRIWWPMATYLPEGGRLVIVPDDALNTIPFAVLPWAQDASQQLILQRAETAVIPSALFLTRVHPAASAHSETPRIALIGDPVFRVADWRRECTETDTAARTVGPPSRPADRSAQSWTESLPRLPGTRLEITAIARLARESRPASRIETLVGCAAVPTALRKAADADVDLLHIATHARIDAQRPRLSALALTPESPTDIPASTFGLLDILGLKLNSKLVVLSACDTSRGKLLPGEGVLGPAQAFLQAGSAAVLASYWRVDDQITSTFMQRFYRYLLVDRLSASAALRKTQLESAASGNSYEWAAFSLYGWPDSSI
jgi:CHAT domain-containing protein/tetratricopeptide (TPR) repeat protein